MDFVADVVDLPGRIIGKTISGIGNAIGTDNVIGEYIVAVGNIITSLSKWASNIVGNPYDTVSSLFTSTNNSTTQPKDANQSTKPADTSKATDANQTTQPQPSKWDKFLTGAKELGSDIVDGACDAYHAVTGATHPITYYATANGVFNHAFRNDDEYDDEPLLKW